MSSSDNSVQGETIDRRLLESKERIAELKAYHDQSGPYKHCVINQLCNHEFLRKIHDELTTHVRANFKETDLFKLFQTSELGAIDEETMIRDLPNLLRLRTILYSEQFRKIVQEITGCDELIDRVDCSSNAYANSCHLLCHDDVIGTRRVSYIIYLSDPDESWTAEDGGAIELYPLESSSIVKYDDAGEQGIPVPIPTKAHIPFFNSMLFFTVQPGRSYHSVQEVFSKTRPRLSISGWYHGATPPIGSDRSSLKQIMTSGDDMRPFLPISPSDGLPNNEDDDEDDDDDDDGFGEFGLTNDDIVFLRSWISSEYLSRKGIKSIAKQFINDSSVQLNNFLVREKILKVTKLHIQADHEEGFGKCKPQLQYEKGITENWKIVGPPHKRRYLTYSSHHQVQGEKTSITSNNNNKADQVGEELNEIRKSLFNSPAFTRYLRAITTLTITGIRDEVRRFRCGFDYTVAHYGILTKEPRLDTTLCFVNDDIAVEQKALGINKKKNKKEVPKGNSKKKMKLGEGGMKPSNKEESEDVEEEEVQAKENDYDSDYGEVWEDGEVGGFECFIEAEQDSETAEAAEVYRSENNKKSDDEEPTLLSVSPCNNSLSIVLRDEGIMKFIKYVSANAPGSRWDVTAEYSIIKEDDDDDEEDESDDDDEDEEGEEEQDDEDVAEEEEVADEDEE
jgi:Rps23 Pro-64 3,4-dihydroxylase Tpa1-like proline 4-hydroxylase